MVAEHTTWMGYMKHGQQVHTSLAKAKGPQVTTVCKQDYFQGLRTDNGPWENWLLPYKSLQVIAKYAGDKIYSTQG